MILIGIILNSVSKIGNIKDMMVSGVFHKLVMQHGLTTRGQNPDFHNQEEIDDRGSFQNETDQTVQWLSEAKMELERLDPGKEVADVVERIEKQKVYNDG
jgi:hypothetical protein